MFDPTAVFGSAASGKTQGRTGQGASAANFLPATTAEGNLQGGTGQGISAADFFSQGRQNDEEAVAHDVRGSGAGAATNPSSDDEGYNLADARGGYMVDTDRQAMCDLADNKSIRGTSANRMAADVRAAEAAPEWTGAGANYTAWLQELRENPMKPDAAIIDGAPEWAYLVVMNGGAYMSVIHHLFRLKAPDGGHSRLDGCIVAFEGEVRDVHGLPRLWRFDCVTT